MIIYYSGCPEVDFKEPILLELIKYRLHSWPYCSEKILNRFRKQHTKAPYKSIMLDSGAFTNWTKGIPLDMDSYVDFIQSNSDLFDLTVSVDKIPSTPFDKKASSLIKAFNESADTSYNNLWYLIDKGIPKEKIIPVFHQGENFKWLRKLISDGFPVVGISPGNDRNTSEKYQWLQDCFGFHSKDVKFHGFAVTSTLLMKSFPWYSVDSASWAVGSGMGNLLVPGKSYTDYLNPEMIYVSDQKNSFQYRGLEEYLNKNIGLELVDVVKVFSKRALAYVYALEKFKEEITKRKPYLNTRRSKKFKLR